MDTYALSNLTPRTLELFIASPSIVEASRTALEKVLAIKGRLSAAEARLAAAERETAEIAKDQGRLRENIKALEKTPEGHDLIARYVAKAQQQETRIEQLTNERRTANDECARLQSELDAAFQALATKTERDSANPASAGESL
jgi:chromosome segregation ATPase